MLKELKDHLQNLGTRADTADWVVAQLDQLPVDSPKMMRGSCVMTPIYREYIGSPKTMALVSERPLFPQALRPHQFIPLRAGVPLNVLWWIAQTDNCWQKVFAPNNEIIVFNPPSSSLNCFTHTGVKVYRPPTQNPSETLTQINYIPPQLRKPTTLEERWYNAEPGNVRHNLSMRINASQAKVKKVKNQWWVHTSQTDEAAMLKPDSVTNNPPNSQLNLEMIRFGRVLRVNYQFPTNTNTPHLIKTMINRIDNAHQNATLLMTDYSAINYRIKAHWPMEMNLEAAMEVLNILRLDTSWLQYTNNRPPYLWPYLNTSGANMINPTKPSEFEELAYSLVNPTMTSEIDREVEPMRPHFDNFCRNNGYFPDWHSPTNFIRLLYTLLPLGINYPQEFEQTVIQKRRQRWQN